MRVLLALLLSIAASTADAQSVVHFASLDGPPATQLDGYVFEAPGAGRHPALVFMPGCGGMFSRSGAINARERDWAARLNAQGVTVMEVDSLGPRNHGEMCAPAHFVEAIYRARSLDAYAALRYLQGRPDVLADRIGVMGWSQGGGTVLNSIRATSEARPSSLPQGDFRVAVAFYPASCNVRAQGDTWASPVPLLLMLGAKDVWIPFDPCVQLMTTIAPGTSATTHVYPNAYHDFDWPDMRVHEVAAFTTRKGVVPIEGMDPDARADAQGRVGAFLAERLLAH